MSKDKDYLLPYVGSQNNVADLDLRMLFFCYDVIVSRISSGSRLMISYIGSWVVFGARSTEPAGSEMGRDWYHHVHRLVHASIQLVQPGTSLPVDEGSSKCVSTRLRWWSVGSENRHNTWYP